MVNKEFSKLTWLKDMPALKLNGAQANVLIAVFNYSQADGTGSYASVDRLAADCKLNTKTVRKALNALVDMGALMRVKRGGRDGSGRNWASKYELGDISTGSIGSLKRVNGSSQEGQLTPLSDPSPDPESDPLELRSKIDRVVKDEKRKAKDSQDEEEAQKKIDDPLPSFSSSFSQPLEVCDGGPLPAGWHVNGSHVESAKRHGVHAGAVGEVFRAWAVGEGQQARDWDRRFGWLVNALGEHWLEDPEVMGMENLGCYSKYPDDPEWFLRGEYRWTVPVWNGSKACWFYARDKAGMSQDQYDETLAGYVARVDGSLPPMALEDGFKKLVNARLISA